MLRGRHFCIASALVCALILSASGDDSKGSSESTDCKHVEPCAIRCQYGLTYDENGCEICQCFDPCKDVNCAPQEACEVQVVQCIRAPCPPIGVCVPTAADDCKYIEPCSIRCQYGLTYDENGCEICQCFDPCKDVKCAPQEACEVQMVQCIRAPCPPLGVCVPTAAASSSINSSLVCKPIENCEISCQYGLTYDENECEICQCFDPCEDVKCGPGESCEVQAVQCIRAPCPQRGVCVTETRETTTQPSLDLCLLSADMGFCKAYIPRWFFNVSALECQPFVYGGCNGNDNNFETQEACLNRCLPTLRACPAVTCSSSCQTQYDSNGCPTCACPESSCKDVQCNADQTCLMVPGLCDEPDQTCYPTPQCLSISEAELIPTSLSPKPSSEAEQLSTVRRAEICTLSAVMGPCKALIERWFYNPSTGMCEMFNYGGCQGNENNFATMEDCVTKCSGEKHQCPEVMCDSRCRIEMGPDGCNNCVCEKECPPVHCSRECQYGIQIDSNGCKSCNCVDPCLNMKCPTGQMCTYRQQPICDGDVCQLSYIGQCTAATVGCPSMNCSNSCTYGRVKNSDRCPTCECLDPCQSVMCEAGEVCKILSALTCLGEDCEMRHVGMCGVPCQSVRCEQSCEYGSLKDSNNCDTCECVDPCKGVTCKAGEICQRKAIATYVGENGEVKEVFIGQCEPEEIMCLLFIPCESKYCDHGVVKDSNGCVTCQCYEPCKNIICSDGETCTPSRVIATKQHPYSFIGLCTEIGKYCTYEMQQNLIRYAHNLQDSPELNCDSRDFYKPMQCNEMEGCYCTSPLGVKGIGNLNEESAIDACFADNKIVGLLRIQADIGIIRPGEGSNFKQVVSKKIADTLLMEDYQVTVTKYYSGSIMVKFVATGVNSTSIGRTAEAHISGLQNTELEYNGMVYRASLVNYEIIKLKPSLTSVSPPEGGETDVILGRICTDQNWPWIEDDRGGLSGGGLMTVVFVVPIVCAGLLAAAIVFCVCRLRKRSASYVPNSNRSSKSFDGPMEKGDGLQNGFENPSYNNAKINPLNANFYSGSTVA